MGHSGVVVGREINKDGRERKGEEESSSDGS